MFLGFVGSSQVWRRVYRLHWTSAQDQRTVRPRGTNHGALQVSHFVFIWRPTLERVRETKQSTCWRQMFKLCNWSHALWFFFSAGVGRTGVFITLSCVLERMQYEGVVDVFQTGTHWLCRILCKNVYSLTSKQFHFSADSKDSTRSHGSDRGPIPILLPGGARIPLFIWSGLSWGWMTGGRLGTW